MPTPSDTAAATVLALAQQRDASLGAGRLVCVDGPAGAGKTTLAAALAALVPGCSVVHMDDLYPGWDGLPVVGGQLHDLLDPLAAGRAGRYRRWEWDTSRWGDTVVVDPASLLVLEGVGSGSRESASYATVLVWVDAPHDVRMRRGLDRDGPAFAPYWERWAAAEALHFAEHGTRERADLLLDGAR